ncbi:beta-lactamase class A [Actinacidiphila yanglinensis]|uniref:Beta-lactamase class A n=1 Tax=Actinacidiphila yanglinensis TaxID=310779 RepID=A0A1H6C6Z9_9ACTN|nr:serine hydrolase [Actinacidiphila yanglinensis]SEG68156.1 beta-lactamase class A [Actinacidiphila yanglinensis]
MTAAGGARTVEQAIRDMFADAGVRGWLHASDLDRPDARVTIDPEHPAPMGSLYKVPLMAAFCRLVDAGALDPRARVTLEPSDHVPGPTGISLLRDPVSVSLRDLVVLMMTISDNTAGDAVLREVGAEAVEEVCRDLGMSRTHIEGGTARAWSQLVTETGTRSLGDAIARISDNDATIPPRVYDPLSKASGTPADLGRLLRAIWTDRAASAANCAFMREIMGRQAWRHRLASGFPYDDVTVSGKTGTFGAMRHEAGVVALPGGGTYVVAVFTRAARVDHRLPRADAVIGAAARAAVEELARGRDG